MGAVDLLGVEPDVALEGHLGGELVVLAVVLAHRDPQPRGGAKLHGLARHPLLPLGGRLAPAEVARVGQLLRISCKSRSPSARVMFSSTLLRYSSSFPPFSIWMVSISSAVLALL